MYLQYRCCTFWTTTTIQHWTHLNTSVVLMTDPWSRAVSDVSLWPLVSLGLQVRIPQGGGAWISVVSVVCFQEGVSASGWSLVQRSPTAFGREASIMLRSWPTRGCCAVYRKLLSWCPSYHIKWRSPIVSRHFRLSPFRSSTRQCYLFTQFSILNMFRYI